MGCTITISSLEVLAAAREITERRLDNPDEIADLIFRRRQPDPKAGAALGHWSDDIEFKWVDATGVCVMTLPDSAETPYAPTVAAVVGVCQGVRCAISIGPNLITLSKSAACDKLSCEAYIRAALRDHNKAAVADA